MGTVFLVSVSTSKTKYMKLNKYFFIICVICKWYSKFTKFIKVENAWFLPGQRLPDI